MKRILFALAATASALAVTPAANATVLVPDASGVAFSAFDTTTRGTLLGSLETSLAAGGATTYDGFMRSAVYRNTLGTLDFYFQVAVTSINAGDEVFNLTATNFTGYFVDALVDTGAVGIFTAANNPNTQGPAGSTTTASRSGGGGQVVRADFGANGLEAAGQTSATYIYRTNAIDFSARGGTFTTQDGSVAQRANFTPVGPGVPEPATWAMMLLGFGAMGAMLRRRPQTSTRIRFA